MIFYQQWHGYFNDEKNEIFDVNVPGNIQYDYAVYKQYGDLNYGDNFKKLKQLEEYSSVYFTELKYELKKGERLFFVSYGIDYEFEIFVNGAAVYKQEGMFSTVNVDITDYLKDNNILEVKINKPPKAEADENDIDTRTEARECVKPAVSYGWDFHPRLIPTGIWDETYLETRGNNFIRDCEVFYELNDDFSSAAVHFEIDCEDKCLIELISPEGESVYSGYNTDFDVINPQLWWCNGQGEAALYFYKVSSSENEVSGYIGFRDIKIVMNSGAWIEPIDFPKSRSVAPITIQLNGRTVFAKGSNWVNPEIFFGRIDKKRYEDFITLAKDANMNIIRCWGGSIINKQAFFDLCDKNGIMVWQEFPLACNCYSSSKKYLDVLEREATSIVKRVRRHASHVLWCGGNELFNAWSKMTDQSAALRLLNMVCYKNDFKKPFIMTSPLMGMGHGYYMFYDKVNDKDIIQMMNNSNCTAYTEFGIPSMSTPDILRRVIPKSEIDNMRPGTSWESHHTFNAWESDSWCSMDIVTKYFGEQKTLDEFCEKTWLLQGEGLRFVFEEARRQKPYCSMALNWDLNEPWCTAAGSNIITYDGKPKKSYYKVKDALRPILASARAEKFEYCYGEEFKAELWLLNDSQETVEDTIDAYITIDGKKEFVMEWKTGTVDKNTNKKGNILCCKLPKTVNREFCLTLKSQHGYDSKYTFMITEKVNKREKTILN